MNFVPFFVKHDQCVLGLVLKETHDLQTTAV